MLTLHKSHIHLRQKASSKQEALAFVARKMTDAGLVGQGFVEGLTAREALASSYIDNGIAMPHSLPEYRCCIRKKGVVVIQFPAGVKWDDQNIAHLVFAIAATSSEHLEVLSHLARILDNVWLCEKLATAQEPESFIWALQGRDVTASLVATSGSCRIPQDDTHQQLPAFATSSPPVVRKFLISNDHGFHARCCRTMVATLESLDAWVHVRNLSKNSTFVNARSLVKLLSLELVRGETMEVRVSGRHGEEVLLRLDELTSRGWGEG